MSEKAKKQVVSTQCFDLSHFMEICILKSLVVWPVCPASCVAITAYMCDLEA